MPTEAPPMREMSAAMPEARPDAGPSRAARSVPGVMPRPPAGAEVAAPPVRRLQTRMPAGGGIVAPGPRVTAPGRARAMPVPMPQVGEAAGADASSATLADFGAGGLTNIPVPLIVCGTAWVGAAHPFTRPRMQ